MLYPSVPPALFKEPLRNVKATEEGTATLCCELTKAAPVEWMKGQHLLREGDKYKMRQEGSVVKLLIQDLELTDAAEYTCVCGDQKTAASLTVHGKEVKCVVTYHPTNCTLSGVGFNFHMFVFVIRIYVISVTSSLIVGHGPSMFV